MDGKAVNQLRIINEKSDISFKLINGEITWDYPAKLNDEAIHSFIHRLDQYFFDANGGINWKTVKSGNNFYFKCSKSNIYYGLFSSHNTKRISIGKNK